MNSLMINHANYEDTQGGRYTPISDGGMSLNLHSPKFYKFFKVVYGYDYAE